MGRGSEASAVLRILPDEERNSKAGEGVKLVARWRVAAAFLGVAAVVWPVNLLGPLSSARASSAQICNVSQTCVSYAPTVGVPNAAEPSGMAPPLAGSLVGYSRTYVNDFAGATLPTGWLAYTGQPGGDPGALWEPSHVSVANGVLALNAYKDSAFSNQWVTGGVCQCGRSKTYGAYFVRSRMTGPGPTVVELLWPASGSWPPEVDFNETFGASNRSVATVHFGATNLADRRYVKIDMTKWHSWGILWTPTSVTYVVDGLVWGVVDTASEIPTIPMTLDLQQQTWCSKGFACPTSNQSTLVDWVAEYSQSSSLPSPAAKIVINDALPRAQLDAVVRDAAGAIFHHHARTVLLRATIAVRTSTTESPAGSVLEIKGMLERDVRSLGINAPRIFVHWSRTTAVVDSPVQILLIVSP